ncbi:hypothetical protein ACH3XW_22015 [Acanthocheilonema viteae]
MDKATDVTSIKEAESTVSNDYDDLFTLKNLGRKIPMKSAVHTLNKDVLKKDVAEETLENFRKKMDVRKEYLKLQSTKNRALKCIISNFRYSVF